MRGSDVDYNLAKVKHLSTYNPSPPYDDNPCGGHSITLVNPSALDPFEMSEDGFIKLKDTGTWPVADT